MQPRYREPLYLQIAERLRSDIGVLNSGARIPSEPAIAKAWGVSRFTVTKAVEQLVAEGLITRRQGSGSFVAEAPLKRAPGYLLSFTEAVQAGGHVATHRLLTFGPTQEKAAAPFEAGTKLVILDRLRFVNGVAVARHLSLLPAAIVEHTALTHEIAAAPGFSLYRHFAENGLAVGSATERLVATIADAEARQLLGLGPQGAVVAVTRHTFAADGTALDATRAVYDAARYSYEARLVRQASTTTGTQEKDHAEDTAGWSGPRLGPWTD